MNNKINGIDVSECNIRFNQFEKNICELGNRKLGELHYLCSENPNCYFKQLKRLQEENEELKKLKCKFKEYCTCDIEKYRSALEEIIDIAEKLITETPEYHSCYYKDECGDNCIPKKQSKVEYCCYENVDKILTIINEVLNDRY